MQHICRSGGTKAIEHSFTYPQHLTWPAIVVAHVWYAAQPENTVIGTRFAALAAFAAFAALAALAALGVTSVATSAAAMSTACTTRNRSERRAHGGA